MRVGIRDLLWTYPTGWSEQCLHEFSSLIVRCPFLETAVGTPAFLPHWYAVVAFVIGFSLGNLLVVNVSPAVQRVASCCRGCRCCLRRNDAPGADDHTEEPSPPKAGLGGKRR